ncbi:MAG: peptide chain release factor N(5)-glutamine methyltransferase [Caloramator sp.]|nr:peptide chain release factor N(5)-glutamine methyltransferase [Caloramator sp.]
MTFFEVLNMAKDILKNHNKPIQEAEIILSHILKRDRTYIHCHLNDKIDETLEKSFFDMIKERAKGRPLQYILGEWEFYGLKFIVKEGVLIPRPDTEVLVEKCLEIIKNINGPKIIDIGCGSGAISIAIAHNKKDSTVYALDIDSIPLEITRLNAEKNNVLDRVHIKKSDLLKSLGDDLKGKVDLIVSNPPYIKEEEIKDLMEEVKNFEPKLALSGGEDGLYFYREISKEAKEYLKKNGYIAFEIGYNQGMDVEKILEAEGYKEVNIYKDLAGLDRVVIAKYVDNL